MLRSADLLAPFRATLSQGFNLRISPPVACQLPSDLALIWVGLSPISNKRLAGHTHSKKSCRSSGVELTVPA
ncbi:hypothetical protein [Aneurinibacillus tyrosinisolvens]|uniref:hypothetical protein n=1 Tax=Aneurinibacillus tyrosinisolvens TaxID=1443435 RepID=UPI000ABBBED7|nr:hypothetical protein [Aneurinibacillus tyrosinisolvens]